MSIWRWRSWNIPLGRLPELQPLGWRGKRMQGKADGGTLRDKPRQGEETRRLPEGRGCLVSPFLFIPA